VIKLFLLGQLTLRTLLGCLENEDAQRHMDLRRGKPGPVGVDHGLDHVGDQAANLRCRGIRDGLRYSRQNGMAHAGNLEDGHGLNMGLAPPLVKATPSGTPSPG